MKARYHIEELLDIHDEDCRRHQDFVGDSGACCCDLPERLLCAFEDGLRREQSPAYALAAALVECGVVQAPGEVTA